MPSRSFHPGTVFEVPIDSEWHTYGRMLEDDPYFAFHDFRTNERAQDLVAVIHSPVLFVLAVRWHYHEQGRAWPVAGKVPLDVVKTAIPDQFVQNSSRLDRLIIMDSKGRQRPATVQECIGLERVVVWDAHHVEERLRDHYAGRENAQVERFKLKM